MSTVGNIMSTVGRYLEFRGDIIIHMGVIISTVRGVQYSGGYILCNLSSVWDIMSTVGGVQYHLVT